MFSLSPMDFTVLLSGGLLVLAVLRFMHSADRRAVVDLVSASDCLLGSASDWLL